MLPAIQPHVLTENLKRHSKTFRVAPTPRSDVKRIRTNIYIILLTPMSNFAPRVAVVGCNYLRSNLGAKIVRDTQMGRDGRTIRASAPDYSLVADSLGSIVKSPATQVLYSGAFVISQGAKAAAPISLRNMSRVNIPTAKSCPPYIFRPAGISAPKLDAVEAPQSPRKVSPFKPEKMGPGVNVAPTGALSPNMGGPKSLEMGGIKRIATSFRGFWPKDKNLSSRRQS